VRIPTETVAAAQACAPQACTPLGVSDRPLEDLKTPSSKYPLRLGHIMACAVPAINCFSERCATLRTGDEVHLFHVIAAAHAETLGGFGGVGGVDELIAAEPDPATDRAHVHNFSLLVDKTTLFLASAFEFCRESVVWTS